MVLTIENNINTTVSNNTINETQVSSIISHNHAIELNNITFKYKKKGPISLTNVSFVVEHGSFHVFIGENGAGKTTTMKVINNLVLDYTGDVFINGNNPKSKHCPMASISYFLDITKFPKNLSIYEYLFNSSLIFRNDIDILKLDIDEYLVNFGISEHRDKSPLNLSLGQKKKVLLIKSLLEKSTIFILDEPVANLDPTTRLQFFHELKKHQMNGITVFISTHVISEIKEYIDSATFIKKGEIIWSGKIDGELLLSKYMELIVDDNNTDIKKEDL